MNTNQATYLTRFKVGLFTLLSLALIGAMTFLVNNRPYWWKTCQVVNISVEDATGLKTKSPVRSLGIEIGYLQSVMLTETHVILGICVTAPVEVLAETRAYIRGEGFLGDKFVELKPVKYVGRTSTGPHRNEVEEAFQRLKNEFWRGMISEVWADDGKKDLPAASENKGTKDTKETKDTKDTKEAAKDVAKEVPGVIDTVVPPSGSDTSAVAHDSTLSPDHPSKRGREIPVGEESQDIGRLVNRVNDLIGEVSGAANNLKKAIDPDDLKKTMQQLNRTLENASKTLAPEGGLNQTAQRTLAKLEDFAEQLRDLSTRINKGEGSLGMLLNDPTYADEIRLALRNTNKLLNKVDGFRFLVDVGAAQLTQYNGGRGWFQLAIWPNRDRYYLLGISTDPRGLLTNTITTTTAGGFTQVTQTQVNQQTGILLTGMLGKVFFDRIDLSVGALYGDGAGSVALRLGPTGAEEKFQIRNDVYFRNSASSLDDRISLSVQPFSSVYLTAGIESVHQYQATGKLIFYYGAGLRFDDEDIKTLFAFK